MLAVSILFCNLDFIGCHVFDIRSGHIYFQGQYSAWVFSALFPFCLQCFLSFILCFGCISFQSFPCYSFSAAAPGISVLQGSLIPCRITGGYFGCYPSSRVFSYIVTQYQLTFTLQFLSFIDHLLIDPVRRIFVGFGISPILFSGSSGIAVSSCSVLPVCRRFLISACGVFSFFVSYAYFVLRCLVFALPSFIHAQSVHEFALLACCYSRWVFKGTCYYKLLHFHVWAIVWLMLSFLF